MNKFFAVLKSKFTYSNSIFLLLCASFLIAASLQSLIQHQQFLTAAWDLGFHNQLMYKFSHFKNPSATLWNPQHPLTCFLGDHVTLLMPINSQLYWIFGSYAMLIAQILYGLVGAIGLYKLIKYKFDSEFLGLVAVFLFFTHYSLYSALDFDAHDNVYGMMFLPWILYFYYKDNFKGFLFSLGIFLFAREDLSLTAIMLGFCFLLFDWKTKKKYGFIAILLSGIYFLVAYKIIIPYFSPWPNGGYVAWRFEHIGNSISEVIWKTITHPSEVLPYFIDCEDKQNKIKFFLLTGGFFFLIRPQFALLAVPTFFTTCFSNSWPLWGNMYHYNILFAVLLPFVIISAAEKFKNRFFRFSIIAIAIFLNLYFLNENSFRDYRTFGRIFTNDYYHQRQNQKEIEEGLTKIPPTASVSATTCLTPHLALRDKVYFLPAILDAEYIAINESDGKNRFYPLESSEIFFKMAKQIRSSAEFEIIYDKNEMLVLRKKK